MIGTAVVFFIRSLKDERPQAWWSAAGVYYAGFPAIALIWIRSDAAYGWLAILYLFAIVWTTDSAAYLFGRWIGGPKLAPRISPKKTWAGLIGGALSAGIAGLVFAQVAGREFSGWLGVLAIGLALMAQLGDLGESAMKRLFGIKDFKRPHPRSRRRAGPDRRADFRRHRRGFAGLGHRSGQSRPRIIALVLKRFPGNASPT